MNNPETLFSLALHNVYVEDIKPHNIIGLRTNNEIRILNKIFHILFNFVKRETHTKDDMYHILMDTFKIAINIDNIHKTNIIKNKYFKEYLTLLWYDIIDILNKMFGLGYIASKIKKDNKLVDPFLKYCCKYNNINLTEFALHISGHPVYGYVMRWIITHKSVGEMKRILRAKSEINDIIRYDEYILSIVLELKTFDILELLLKDGRIFGTNENIDKWIRNNLKYMGMILETKVKNKQLYDGVVKYCAEIPIKIEYMYHAILNGYYNTVDALLKNNKFTIEKIVKDNRDINMRQTTEQVWMLKHILGKIIYNVYGAQYDHLGDQKIWIFQHQQYYLLKIIEYIEIIKTSTKLTIHHLDVNLSIKTMNTRALYGDWDTINDILKDNTITVNKIIKYNGNISGKTQAIEHMQMLKSILGKMIHNICGIQYEYLEDQKIWIYQHQQYHLLKLIKCAKIIKAQMQPKKYW